MGGVEAALVTHVVAMLISLLFRSFMVAFRCISGKTNLEKHGIMQGEGSEQRGTLPALTSARAVFLSILSEKKDIPSSE